MHHLWCTIFNFCSNVKKNRPPAQPGGRGQKFRPRAFGARPFFSTRHICALAGPFHDKMSKNKLFTTGCTNSANELMGVCKSMPLSKKKLFSVTERMPTTQFVSENKAKAFIYVQQHLCVVFCRCSICVWAGVFMVQRPARRRSSRWRSSSSRSRWSASSASHSAQ